MRAGAADSPLPIAKERQRTVEQEQSRCAQCSALLPRQDEVRFCPQCGQPVNGGGRRTPAASSAWTRRLDAAWDFFASTRVATVLIFLIAVASIGGTLVEQESLYQDPRPPADYYPARYGPVLGTLLLRLGLTHAYTSTWFLALLYLTVISLVVCSLQRLVPLHRALMRPAVSGHKGFVSRQPTGASLPPGPEPDALAPLAAALQQRGFRLFRSGAALHADRGRLSRYGPYVIHIGLIICALAAASKALPGWDVTHDLWVAEGQTVKVPGTALALRNERFTYAAYPDGRPRLFRTDAVLLDRGEEVRRQAVEVNRPLRHQGWEFYQASFQPEPARATFRVYENASDRQVGTVTFDLKDPERSYRLPDGRRIEVVEYFHDFAVDQKTGQFINASRDIINPAFLLSFFGADGEPVGIQALVVNVRPGPLPDDMPLVARGDLRLEQAGNVELRWYTGLKVHKDRSVPYMYGGLAVVLLGMWITFFLSHHQVWAVVADGGILVGARANKNRFGLERQLAQVVDGLNGRLTRALSIDAG